MKRRLVSLFIVILLALPALVKAQAPSVTDYQPWTKVAESTTLIDISSQVIKCHPDSASKVQLNVFNENSFDQLAHFTLRLINPVTLEEVTKVVSKNIEKYQMLIASCENNNYPELELNVPMGWNPATVKISITFIP